MAFSLSPGAIAAAGDMWDGPPNHRITLADQVFTSTGSGGVISFSTGATAISFSAGCTAVRAVIWCKIYNALGTVFTVGNVATVWRLIVSDSNTVSLNTRTIATAVGPRDEHCVVLAGVAPEEDQSIFSARIQADVPTNADAITFDAAIDATP